MTGSCDICGCIAKLDHDHDHSLTRDMDGYWRGWLCRSCNVRLGYWEAKGVLDPYPGPNVDLLMALGHRFDDLDWFEKAWLYLP